MLLQGRWKILLFGIAMQYVHGIFTQLAHRMHQPGELLHDVGFELTPELGPGMFWVSELIFGTLFVMFFVWTFTPFFFYRKRFYTVVLWCRLLMVLVVCQVLRILSFSFTQLPGPAYHCRDGEATAIRPWPDHWYEHLFVDVKRVSTKSCGDLIFSSHTIFMLTGILAYHEFGTNIILKAVAWTSGVFAAMLIISSRKHYTVDIVIAWYTVPLVFYTLQRRWTTVRPDIDLGDEIAEQVGSASSSKSGLSLKRDEEEDWRVSVKLEAEDLKESKSSETEPILRINCLDPHTLEDVMESGGLSSTARGGSNATLEASSSGPGGGGTAHISVSSGRSTTSSQRRSVVSSMQSEGLKQGLVDQGEGDKGGAVAPGRSSQTSTAHGTNYLRVDVWWRGGEKKKAMQRQQE